MSATARKRDDVSPSAEEEYFASLEEDVDGPGLPEILLAVTTLTARQRFVIELRFGLKDGHPYSQNQVAALMGVTQQAVADAEKHALQRIRTRLQIVL